MTTAAVAVLGCSILTRRPVQEMSDTAAAIKAAKEVEADTSSPDLYRESQEWYLKAKNEYRLKNFSRSLEYLEKARKYAEQAEFDAVKGGASRREPPMPEEPKMPEPYAYPTPTGTPAAEYDKRYQDDLKKQSPQSPFQQPNSGVTPPTPPAAGSGYPPTPAVPAAPPTGP